MLRPAEPSLRITLAENMTDYAGVTFSWYRARLSYFKYHRTFLELLAGKVLFVVSLFFPPSRRVHRGEALPAERIPGTMQLRKHFTRRIISVR